MTYQEGSRSTTVDKFPNLWDKGFTYHRVGCNGTEEPFLSNGKWYLYVFNIKARQHEYYSYSDDMFCPDSYFIDKQKDISQ